ncbi:unnamed protein product [Eruca vesicaria subsp. sativa]|uniref:Uncharacterized protein n=1 Tax=Eruca vesicaria subsp. sativa TaxID=29727 RepID=A0ABC8L1P2_ERUVS|nr:unnamed protein product [Eruca vesicaria subsp. sativa]
MAPRLKPTRPPPTYSELFGIDGIGSSGPSSSEHVPDSQAFRANNPISRSVLDTIKGYFFEPHPNWSITPDHECLDSLEDLLDIMATGNPVMQRALNERRADLGMQKHPPESTGRPSPELTRPDKYLRNNMP